MANLWHIGIGPQDGAETDEHFTTAELTRDLCRAIRGEIEPLIDPEIAVRDAHREQARSFRALGSSALELDEWRKADEAQIRVTGLGTAYDDFNPDRGDVGTFRYDMAAFRTHVEQLIAERFPLPAGTDDFVHVWRCEIADCPHCTRYRRQYEDEEYGV